MIVVLLCALLSIPFSQTLEIPYIADAIFVPRSPTPNTTQVNMSCDECLCFQRENRSAVINCFSDNHTCQFFFDFPRRYRIQQRSNARIFFPQGRLPNASECCMPDLQELLNKLNNASRMNPTNASQSRCLIKDDDGLLVTVNEYQPYLQRFHPYSLSLHNQHDIQSSLKTIASREQFYYIGAGDNILLTVNRSNMSIINRTETPEMKGPRDMIFLKDGEIMVLSSADNNRLLFFNRSSDHSFLYQYSNYINTSFSTPHGLWRFNDSFFYVATWNTPSIYSYSMTDHKHWTPKLFANGSERVNGSQFGSHLWIDECQRRWFSIYDFGFLIYDEGGNYLGNFTRISNTLFDAFLEENYTMYLSQNNENIVRLDPQINCDF